MVYLGISNTSSPFAVMIFNEIPSISLPSVESITPSAKPPSFSRGTQHDRFGSYGWKVSNISYYKMKLLLNVTMCRNLRYNWLDYMLTSILVEWTVPKHYKLNSYDAESMVIQVQLQFYPWYSSRLTTHKRRRKLSRLHTKTNLNMHMSYKVWNFLV